MNKPIQEQLVLFLVMLQEGVALRKKAIKKRRQCYHKKSERDFR